MSKKPKIEKNSSDSSKKIQLKTPPSKSMVNFKPTLGSPDDPMKYVGQSPAASTLEPASSEHPENRPVTEAVVSISNRRKRANRMRRLSSKLTRIRKNVRNQFAPERRLHMRTNKKARAFARAKFGGARGKAYASLPISSKMAIDKLISNKGQFIKHYAKRLMPIVRRLEASRVQSVRRHKSPIKLRGASGLGIVHKPKLDRADYNETRTDILHENHNSVFMKLLTSLSNNPKLRQKIEKRLAHRGFLNKYASTLDESMLTEKLKALPKHLDVKTHPSVEAAKNIARKLKSNAASKDKKTKEAKPKTKVKSKTSNKPSAPSKPNKGTMLNKKNNEDGQQYKRRPTSSTSYHGPVTINNTYHGPANLKEDFDLNKLIALYKKIRGEKQDRIAPTNFNRKNQHHLKHRLSESFILKEEVTSTLSPDGVPNISTKAIITFKRPDKTLGRKIYPRNMVPKRAYTEVNAKKDQYGRNRFATPVESPYKKKDGIVEAVDFKKISQNIRAAKRTAKDHAPAIGINAALTGTAVAHGMHPVAALSATLTGTSLALGKEIKRTFNKHKKEIEKDDAIHDNLVNSRNPSRLKSKQYK